MNLKNSAARAAAHKRAALAQLGGIGEAHRERAGELWTAKIENRTAAKMRETEFSLTANHHLDLFVTPEWLAADMVERADEPLYSGSVWYEPSAGTGRIVQAIIDAGHHPVINELNYNAAQHLREKFPNLLVYNDDFLEMYGHTTETAAHYEYNTRVNPPTKTLVPASVRGQVLADVFVMNPPFSHGQDIDHVRHAYTQLSEGGRIVSIMSEGVFYRSDRKATEFRAWFDEICGQSERLPAGTFKESGTGAATRLVQIDK